MIAATRFLAFALVVNLFVSAAPAAEPDSIEDVKQRLQIEAQRVEREFMSERAAAYRAVRNGEPNLTDALDKLEGLLALLKNDTAVEARRREILIVTVKADMTNVRQIAGERRRTATVRDLAAATRVNREEARRTDDKRRDEGKAATDDIRSIMESRGKMLADARGDRLKSGERYNKLMRSVDDAAIPDSREYVLPKNWLELTKKRSSKIAMTAKEQAIMKALETSMEVDFNKNPLKDVISYLEKKAGIEITVDKAALETAGASYESDITLNHRASTRTIIKKVLADINLTYVIKDEAIHITSRERAAQLTTTRAYYVGDLIGVLDFRLPPVLTQAIMVENALRIQQQIMAVDPQSWRANNPDAPGVVVFDPITMSFLVRQSAEMHFRMAGK